MSAVLPAQRVRVMATAAIATAIREVRDNHQLVASVIGERLTARELLDLPGTAVDHLYDQVHGEIVRQGELALRHLAAVADER